MSKGKESKRDYLAETRDLLKRYPELVGGKLPREVVDAVLEGMSLTEAYENYLTRNLRAVAPVTGIAGGAAVNIRGEDDFLRGFNS